MPDGDAPTFIPVKLVELSLTWLFIALAFCSCVGRRGSRIRSFEFRVGL